MDSQATKSRIVLYLDHVDLALLEALLDRAAQSADAQVIWLEGLGAKSETAERLRAIAEQLVDL